MKKTLLLSMLMLAGLGASAQISGDNTPLADGSIAPDFTATDIYGNTHSLYADYLDQGKSVIIDFSATWCGPCWNYHQTHAMADFYEAYGPAGSDEVMVIFVEADIANTNLDNINGIDGPIAPTQGNWTIGSPYPIIEDTNALNLGAGSNYDVDFFPTLYRICADDKQTRYLNQVTQGSASMLKSIVNSDCQTLIGIANHGRIDAASTSIRICESGEIVTIQGKLKNFGNNAITNSTIVLKENGSVIATQAYTGSLAQFATPATINFNEVALNEGSNYTIEVTDINGVAPANADITTADVNFTITEEGQNNIIKVVVHTDNYPGEASWEIKNGAGEVVASGGPYQEGTEDEFGAGGPDANTAITHWVTLPGNTPECFDVVLKDSFNDGWIYGDTPHGIEIFSSNELVFERWVANFGNTLTEATAFRTMGVLGNETFETSSSFSIYPNPSNGIFTFNTPETVSVTVSDFTGKTVYTGVNIENGMAIDLSNLQSGVYLAKVTGASTERTEKLVIK